MAAGRRVVRAYIAYGDSLSDLPLCGALQCTIAINSDARLEVVAHRC